MSRPRKCRKIHFVPGVTYYKPAGVPIKTLEEVILTKEDVEAIKLKDLDGLEQEEASKKMNTSQPTFHRIITSARKKVAEAIVKGKAMRIEG